MWMSVFSHSVWQQKETAYSMGWKSNFRPFIDIVPSSECLKYGDWLWWGSGSKKLLCIEVTFCLAKNRGNILSRREKKVSQWPVSPWWKINLFTKGSWLQNNLENLENKDSAVCLFIFPLQFSNIIWYISHFFFVPLRTLQLFWTNDT